MIFDSATYRFLALLIIKSYRKTESTELKKKSFHISQKKRSKPFFVSGVQPCNQSARHQKFCWPIMNVKLRKGQKYSKILKTIANFNKILQKFVILKSSEPFHCLNRLSSIPISSLKSFHSLIKIHKLET